MMEEENHLTKSAIKNTRYQLLAQRMTFIEKSMDERLCRVETSVTSLRDNEIAHLAEDVKALRCDMQIRDEKLEGKIGDIQKIIYKAVGAAGAVLTILNIILKVVK